jgi:hypothetical protein
MEREGSMTHEVGLEFGYGLMSGEGKKENGLLRMDSWI